MYAHTTAECSGDYFHATTWAALESIAEHGLLPRQGGGQWSHGGYGAHSPGKVFLAKGLEAAHTWFDKVAAIAWDQYQDEPEPDSVVPVLLKVFTLDEDEELGEVFIDPVGSGDVACSFYVTQAISPDCLFMWHPRKRKWIPIEDWDRTDPYWGLDSVEYYNEDGDEISEDEWDEETGTRGFNVSDEGFSPGTD